jgi:hypothetical protein
VLVDYKANSSFLISTYYLRASFKFKASSSSIASSGRVDAFKDVELLSSKWTTFNVVTSYITLLLNILVLLK